MLLKRTSLFLLSSFVILAIFFNNCTKETDDNPCGCTSNLDDFVNSNYVITDNNSNLLIEGKHKTYDGNYQITLGTIGDANKLQNHFTKMRNTDDSVYTIILYCNKVFGANDTILDSDVVGTSIYCVNDSNLIHNVFIKDSILQMDLIHSYTTRIINLSDVDFIFNNIIKITGDKSYVLVTPDNEVDFATDRSYDNFLTIKYQYLNLTGNTKSTSENPGANQCPSPCPIAFYNMNCYNGLPGDPVYCAGGGCATAAQSQTLIDENAMSTDSVYMAYDTSFQYSYRDDFLMNSSFGNKYIQFYYDLSEFLADESVSISLMLETADLLIDLNHNLEMLIDTIGYSNSIVVDSAMNTRLIDLLIDYRNISTNKEYVDVINDIIYDVNTYSNKTVDYIITDIQ